MADTDNAQRTSFFPKVENVGFTSCMLRDRARDWWEEVIHTVGTTRLVELNWAEFVRRFYLVFAPSIEVQWLVRGLQDL